MHHVLTYYYKIYRFSQMGFGAIHFGAIPERCNFSDVESFDVLNGELGGCSERNSFHRISNRYPMRIKLSLSLSLMENYSFRLMDYYPI